MSESLNNENVSFARIALALANDYSSVYIINTKNDSYVEYSVTGLDKQLKKASSGENFYLDVIYNAHRLVHRDDLAAFLEAFQKEKLLEAIGNGKAFSLYYRLWENGEPVYYFLKTISGTGDDKDYIVIGVRNVDEQVRREKAAAEESETYSLISKALASRYEVIYYVDTDTNAYMEYSSSETYSKLGIVKKGSNFFQKSHEDILLYIHPEDTRALITALNREKLLEQLASERSVTLMYRQYLDGRLQYMKMVIVRPQNESSRLVVGVMNIDEQMRREKEAEKASETFSEIIKALALRYEVIYYVNIETNAYQEYTSSVKYAKLDISGTGSDFFADTQKNLKRDIFPDDYAMMAESMKKSSLLNNLHETGSTSLNYRLMLDGRPQYVTLFAIRPVQDSSHIIVAVANVDAAKRREIAFKEALGSAMDLASRDALTNVKNKHAYVQEEEKLDSSIRKGFTPDFGLVVCDVNGLKHVNDNYGHSAGDEYIKSACSSICIIFKHSPVFRIGGDEFVVLLRGHDFFYREELIADFDRVMAENRKNGLVTVARGMSEFDRNVDMRVQDVFERADSIMYENKKKFKNLL